MPRDLTVTPERAQPWNQDVPDVADKDKEEAKDRLGVVSAGVFD